MLLTSKGAAGVAGGGFIALAATLSTVGTVPAIGIMLVFGIACHAGLFDGPDKRGSPISSRRWMPPAVLVNRDMCSW